MVVRFIKILLMACVVLSGGAQASSHVTTDYTSTEIISEKTGFVPGETTWFAVHQKLRENWHVFWINPGDAGIPLNLDWSLPDGFAPGVELHPAPKFIPVGPLASYAHEGEPVFLVSVTVPQNATPGQIVSINIDAMWQTCEDICVPEDAQFKFDLPVLEQAEIRPEARNLFQNARSNLPEKHDAAASFSREGQRFELRVEDWPASNSQEVFFFPETEGLTTPAAIQSASIDGDLLTISMEPGWTDQLDTDIVSGVITYMDELGAKVSRSIQAEVIGTITNPMNDQPTPTLPTANSNVVFYLVFAFLGGVILNIMPCVFPIIFVKAASFMENAQKDRKIVQQQGLLFTAGILSTFTLMGGGLLLLRAGGEQLGWGFHLQSPIVVAVSAYVLFLVGLNLFGFFTLGENLAGHGDSLTRRGGATGSYFTGVLAVVVAAPCIGPLLTAPMGAALVQPAAIGMLIFLLMGLGLATPYLLLSFIPSAGRFLPRPGPWMVVMKQAMAFPVFAAAAYFLWVFSRQTSASGLALILAGAIFLTIAAWLFEKSKGDSTMAFALRIAAALAALLAVAPLMRVEPATTSAPIDGVYGVIQSEPYDADKLTEYRTAGIPVFIDFTAAWCVTCQFNKMTVLKSTVVAESFTATGTILMVADWTVRDPEITQALEAFGASGVPLYVYYPTGKPAQILPPTLSRKILVEALTQDR